MQTVSKQFTKRLFGVDKSSTSGHTILITTQTLTLIRVLIVFTGQREFQLEHPESEPSSGAPGGWI